MKTKKRLIPKVVSILDLKNKAQSDVRFQQLAISAALNLGGDADNNHMQAVHWLHMNALETTEEGVVEEINFCRDLI